MLSKIAIGLSAVKSRRDDTLLTAGFNLRISSSDTPHKSRRDDTFIVNKVSFMKNMYAIIVLFAFSFLFAACCQSSHQNYTKLAKQLEDSRFLKITMKPFLEDAGLTRWTEKEVLASRSLPLVTDFESLRKTGPGTMHIDRNITISGNGSIRIDTPKSLERKSSSNRAYATTGIVRPLDREDLRDYNRFSVWIYVDAPGDYNEFVGFYLYNEGEKIMPVPGRFEGQHYENVTPGKWQRVVWEIPDLYRDCVTGFGISI